MNLIPSMNSLHLLARTFRVFIKAAFLLMLSALTASAATYYVSSSDPNASDSYTTPTSALPWKTLAKINATTFAPGDTIYLKCGDTWRETLTITSVGSSTGRITFTSYGTGAKPVISGADLVTGWTVYPGGTANTYQATLANTTKMVTADSTYLKKGGTSSTLTANQYYWSAGVLYINIGGDPTTHSIEAAQRDNPVYAYSVKPKFLNYITLLGLRIEKSNLANVFVYNSAFWTVQNCDLFFGNSNSTFSGGGMHAGSDDDLLFTGNHVNYALGDGLMLWYGLRAEVSNNVIENVLDDGGNAGADGIQIGAKSSAPTACNNFKVLNNTVTRPSTNVEKGCIIVEMGDNGIISGNVCTSGRFGIALSGNNCVMSYNYVTGFGTAGGLRVSQDMALSGIQMYYNVVANSPGFTGITIMDDISGAHASRSNFTICNNVVYNTYYGIISSEAFSGKISNNIVWGGANPRVRLSIASIIAGQTLSSDYNILQKSGTETYISVSGTSYSTLAAWQATGQDTHSTTANPLWANASGGDFHLLAGSPAIDTGTNFGYLEDLDGSSVPQGAGPDMGAYEYGSLFAYEGFNYGAGTDLNGANGGIGWASGWVSSGGTGSTTVLSGGFTYTGLPVNGGSFQIYDTDGNPQKVTRTLSKTFGASQETYWISFLAKKLNSGREAYVNFGGLGLDAYQGNAWAIKTPNTSYTAIPGANSDTLHLFVVRVDAGATSDTVRVWMDPVIASGEPSIASALVTLTDTPFSFNTLSIQHGPWGDATQCGQYDEIRLASSFYYATTNPITTNVAQGQTTATDSVNGTYVGANAVDGNITADTSRWISANTAFPHWIEVDFPVARTISEIRFYTGYQGYNYPIAAYTLQRWDAGTSSWVAIISRSGNTNASVDELFTAVSTSKVRLYATQGSVDNYLRLYEIMVMGY